MSLLILGLGLIGGSCALAQRRQFGRIVAIEPNADSRAWALAHGVVDEAYVSLADYQSLRDAQVVPQVVLLCAPVRQIEILWAQLGPHLAPQTLLMDVGSTKQNVIAAAKASLAPAQWAQLVPAHPIAGREFSGPQAAQAQLFQGQQVILTPLLETSATMLARAQAFWQHSGAKVYEMAAAEHDQIFAAVSHLPHLVAYALMGAVATHPEAATLLRHAGASLRDSTRIASSSAVMWRDIALANRAALLQELGAFQVALNTLTQAVEQADGAALEAYFSEVKTARDHWLRPPSVVFHSVWNLNVG